MRNKIVAGNWKMNTNLNEAKNLVNEILQQQVNEEVIKIFFPPFTFLNEVVSLTKNKPHFFVGAQNCSSFASGAYTGEVAASMIQSVGCEYVLIGHSERRTLFNETDEVLLLKVNQALSQNLKIVFCVGEILSQRESGIHFSIVENQLKSVLQNLSAEQIKNTVIAYEPVWAIGTGVTASPEQAQEMHAFIRACLSKLFSVEIANSTSILYGGSCNAQNAKQLFSCKDIDGGLIGGASLKAQDFCTIINSFA